MTSPGRNLLYIMIVLLGLTSAAHAAGVIVSLVPAKPFPLVGYPGDILTDAFKVHLAVSGSTAKKPNNPPDITFCTSLVLNATGVLSCAPGTLSTTTIHLLADTNYTQNPDLLPPDTSVSLTIADDVPCGATYNVSQHVGGNAGSSVDFGGGATFVDLPFAVQVLCSCSGCTLTQGFWKQHPGAWPLSTLKLGNVSYTKDQLILILNESPREGNGLISLAHQLIAAKLNVANGATSPTIGNIIASADTLIGNLVVPPVGSGSLFPSITSSLNGSLTSFNEGTNGPPHCQD